MPVSINNTTLTFNDGTTQTTAASPSSYVGPRVQAFTSNGTFTVPAGVTAVKVSATGGGGGGGGTSNGGAGGSSSFGGLVVGGGGAGGGRGFDNGTECVTATGPAGGASTNIPYQYSNFSLAGSRGNPGNGGAGSPSFCTGGGGGTGSQGVGYVTGLTPGANITVTIGAGGTAGGGGSTVGQPGAIAVEW